MSDKPTRAQVLNEPGGYQFNRWIIENVMKWNEIDDDGSWSPSTHFVDAIELALKMAESGWWMKLNILPNSDPILWECMFHTRKLLPVVVVDAVGKTGPLAICRAALLAVIDDEDN